jgi:predicted PurR-regulated permease PerM
MANNGADDGSRERLLGRITALLWAVVIALAVTFFYFASSLWITLLLAAFLSVLIDPLVTRLERFRIPRSVSSALVVIVGMLLVSVAVYVFYEKATSFMDTLPQYTGKIQKAVEPITKKIQRAQESAGKLNPAPVAKKIPEVRVNDTPSWTSYLARGVGSVGTGVVIAGVVPFLMFFLLLRKEHIYTWLSHTFGNTTDVPLFVNRTSRMVRGFAGGNLIVGSVMAAVTIAVLFAIGLEGAAVIGLASGFLNLIPFLGVLLASIVPLLAATLQFNSAGPFLIIAATVVSLHLLSANLLIPKFVGSRINIGPVAATVGMLFWSWLWGGIGLLMAVPLTAFVKLVADCHPALLPISNLLAERPRPIPRWAEASGARVTRAIPFLKGRFRASKREE